MTGECDVFVVATGVRGTLVQSVGFRLSGYRVLDELKRFHELSPTLTLHAAEIREEVPLAGTAYGTTVRYTRVEWKWERSAPWKRK